MGRSRRLVGVAPKREEELYAALVNAARQQGYPVEGADTFAQQAIPPTQTGMTFAPPPDQSELITRLLMPILAGEFEAMTPRGQAEIGLLEARTEQERAKTDLYPGLAAAKMARQPEDILAEQTMRKTINDEVKLLDTAYQNHQRDPQNPEKQRAWQGASRSIWRLVQPEVAGKAREVADQPTEIRAAEALSNFGSFMGILATGEYNELARNFNVTVDDLVAAERVGSQEQRPWRRPPPGEIETVKHNAPQHHVGGTPYARTPTKTGSEPPIPSMLGLAQDYTRGAPRIVQSAAGLAGLGLDIPIGAANLLAGAAGWLAGTPEEERGQPTTSAPQSGPLPGVSAAQPEPGEFQPRESPEVLAEIAQMMLGRRGPGMGRFGALGNEPGW